MNIPAQPKTYSTRGIQMAYELELIDDAICDLYSGQEGVLYRVAEPDREYIKRDLLRIIESLREWRAKYGMEYPL